MDLKNSATPTEEGDSAVEETVSHTRRDAITKMAYGSPAIAILLLSKSAAAQGSPRPFTPPPPPP